jgi:hypothetical protein
MLGVKEEEARIAIAAAVERAGAEWKGAMEGLTLQLKAAEQKCQVDNCRSCNSVCVCVCQRNSLSLSLSLSLFLTLTHSLSLSLSLRMKSCSGVRLRLISIQRRGGCSAL